MVTLDVVLDQTILIGEDLKRSKELLRRDVEISLEVLEDGCFCFEGCSLIFWITSIKADTLTCSTTKPT